MSRSSQQITLWKRSSGRDQASPGCGMYFPGCQTCSIARCILPLSYENFADPWTPDVCLLRRVIVRELLVLHVPSKAWSQQEAETGHLHHSSRGLSKRLSMYKQDRMRHGHGVSFSGRLSRGYQAMDPLTGSQGVMDLSMFPGAGCCAGASPAISKLPP